MEDWARRDEMRREGKTVRAVSEMEPVLTGGQEADGLGVEDGDEVMYEMQEYQQQEAVPRMMSIANWDNTVWTTLG